MEIVVRATLIYWFLWLVVRGTGKRSLAELTPLDLLLVVILGDFVQQGVTQEDMSVTGAVIAVSVFVAWTLIADRMARTTKGAARVLASSPVMVIHHGRVLMDRMEQERLSLDDLREAARIDGFADFGDIDFAVLEADGKFSFVRRSHDEH